MVSRKTEALQNGGVNLAKRKKNFEYRRACFQEDDLKLEDLVRDAWEILDTQIKRTITFSDDRSTCGLNSHDISNGGVMIHCGRYTDKQGVGTISTKPMQAVNIGELPPNADENFLSNDFMALIRGNHVICMDCGRDAGSLRNYLQELFEKAELPDAEQKFKLVRIANLDKLAMIKATGVKKIELKVGIAKASAGELEDCGDGKRWSDRIWKPLRDVFDNLANQDEKLNELWNSDHGTLDVSINVPK